MRDISNQPDSAASVSQSEREKQDMTNTKFTSKKALVCFDWQVGGMAEKKTRWSVQRDQTLLGRWPWPHDDQQPWLSSPRLWYNMNPFCSFWEDWVLVTGPQMCTTLLHLSLGLNFLLSLILRQNLARQSRSQILSSSSGPLTMNPLASAGITALAVV